MNTLSSFLEGFSPELYLATLAKVAHADGIHPDEEVILTQQAATFGLDPASLPEAPQDLSEIPWATRVLVYRDALMMAYADGQMSQQEEEHLADLATRLQLQEATACNLKTWVNDYSELLSRFESIVTHTQS